MLTIPTITCKRCGKTWVPRIADPKVCPKCKSAWFQTERKQPKKEAGK